VVHRAVAAAVDTGLAWALSFSALAFLPTLLLREPPLRDRFDTPAGAEASQGEPTTR
jgi:hypothetical protein